MRAAARRAPRRGGTRRGVLLVDYPDAMIELLREEHGMVDLSRCEVKPAVTDLTDRDVPRAMHDLGGVSRYMCEAIDAEPHELTDFDREVDAIRQILGMKAVMSVDELRRGIEALPEAEYLRLSYYERWLRSIIGTLLQKGVIDEAELQAAVAAAP